MQNSKNKKIVGVLVGLFVLAGAFCGGMFYQKTKSPSANKNFNFNQANGASMRGPREQGGRGAGMFFGKIVSKDALSITLQLQDGSSKVVFFASSTAFTTTSPSTLEDMQVNSEIMVSGTQNQDGSITARSMSSGMSPLRTR